MSVQSRDTIKAWFQRGLKPLATQFASWMDSYWHKSEDQIPISSIDNLQTTLNDLAPASAITNLLGGVPVEGNTLNKLYQLYLIIVHFRGKYTTLSALQTAYPTANDGDYAIIDAGAGSNAKEYIWDAQEGWIQGSGASTAGAVSFTPFGGISATNVQAALQELDTEKANLLSPIFTGSPAAPTPTGGDNSTKIATTAFVSSAISAISLALNVVLTANNSAGGLQIKNLADPTSPQDADTKAARDAAITAAINAVLNSAPGALDTLKELADALGDDPNFATTVTNSLATKTDKLTPVAVKTGAYTAGANELIPVDASSGNVPIALPSAPADKTRVVIKLIAVSGSFTCTITRGGTDVFNKAGGGTSISLSLLNQAVSLQYNSASGIWYVVSDDIPLTQLDQRFAAAATATGTNTYACSLATPLLAYRTNQAFFIKFTNGNNGTPVTLNIDSMGAKTIKKNSVDDLAVGDIIAGQLVEIVYDGTNFQAIGLTKVLETTVNNIAQDQTTLAIYKSSNFGSP